MFLEIVCLCDCVVGELGLINYEFYKILKFISSMGERFIIEFECSIILFIIDLLWGVKLKLVCVIDGFFIVLYSDCGYCYFMVVLVGKDVLFIKWLCLEYFYWVDEDCSICCLVNLLFGIKSWGKVDNC